MDTTYTVDRQRFRARIDPRTNTIAVSSIHPYDETEYHWARQTRSGEWNRRHFMYCPCRSLNGYSNSSCPIVKENENMPYTDTSE